MAPDFLKRKRSSDDAVGQPGPAAPSSESARAPSGTDRGQMRRRLRKQKHIREALLLDLGALVFELHRHGRREPTLLQAKAAELTVVDEEVRTLALALEEEYSMLDLISTGVAGACENCGTIFTVEARYCANCGAPAVPVLTAEHDTRATSSVSTADNGGPRELTTEEFDAVDGVVSDGDEVEEPTPESEAATADFPAVTPQPQPEAVEHPKTWPRPQPQPEAAAAPEAEAVPEPAAAEPEPDAPAEPEAEPGTEAVQPDLTAEADTAATAPWSASEPVEPEPKAVEPEPQPEPEAVPEPAAPEPEQPDAPASPEAPESEPAPDSAAPWLDDAPSPATAPEPEPIPEPAAEQPQPEPVAEQPEPFAKEAQPVAEQPQPEPVAEQPQPEPAEAPPHAPPGRELPRVPDPPPNRPPLDTWAPRPPITHDEDDALNQAARAIRIGVERGLSWVERQRRSKS